MGEGRQLFLFVSGDRVTPATEYDVKHCKTKLKAISTVCLRETAPGDARGVKTRAARCVQMRGSLALQDLNLMGL